VNQRPTTALLSSCMVMVVIPFIHRHSEDARMNDKREITIRPIIFGPSR
jgi:hypothetical protein